MTLITPWLVAAPNVLRWQSAVPASTDWKLITLQGARHWELQVPKPWTAGAEWLQVQNPWHLELCLRVPDPGSRCNKAELSDLHQMIIAHPAAARAAALASSHPGKGLTKPGPTVCSCRRSSFMVQAR